MKKSTRYTHTIQLLLLSIAILPIISTYSADSHFIIPVEYKNTISSDYKKKYIRLTGFEYSGLHWKQWITIYANQGDDIYKNNYLAYLNQYIDDDEEEERDESIITFTPYIPGTIFLKEHYRNNNSLPENALTTVFMIKHKAGYDPNGGDWEYVQASKEGKVILSGNSQRPEVRSLCQDCHSNMKERDYIFSTYFSAD